MSQLKRTNTEFLQINTAIHLLDINFHCFVYGTGTLEGIILSFILINTVSIYTQKNVKEIKSRKYLC